MPTTDPVTSRPVPPATPSALEPVGRGRRRASSMPMPITAPGTAYPNVVSWAAARGPSRPPPSRSACPIEQRRARRRQPPRPGPRPRRVGERVDEARVERRRAVAAGVVPRPTRPAARRAGGSRAPSASRQARGGQPAARRRCSRSGCSPRAAAALLGEARAAAHQPLAGQHRDREQQHQTGQLGGGRRSRRSPSRSCRRRTETVCDAEVLHGREVGQHLHHHQRQSGGQRRAGQRQQDPEERPARGWRRASARRRTSRATARRTRPGPAGRRRGRASAT